MIIESLKSGVITVGHGRGFVVEGAGERLVITAAHCLPSLPPALPSFGLEARTYGPLLARRGALRGNGFLHENGKTCTKMALSRIDKKASFDGIVNLSRHGMRWGRWRAARDLETLGVLVVLPEIGGRGGKKGGLSSLM